MRCCAMCAACSTEIGYGATAGAQGRGYGPLPGTTIPYYYYALVIDENQKGSISQQELLEFLPRYGLGSEEIETMFTEADANKDGLLDREEFETGLFPKLKAREMGGGGGGGKKGGREAEEAEAKLLFDSFDENKVRYRASFAVARPWPTSATAGTDDVRNGTLDAQNGTLDSMELHRGLAHAGLTEEEVNAARYRPTPALCHVRY
eukprot:89200-Rhodomonas_salina.5